MLGKRVPARVNEGFCDCPGHRRRPNRRVCHPPLLHRSDSLHPAPPKCRWYCCSLCANVLGVRKPLLYATSKSKGINSLAVHTPVSSTVPFVDFQHLELL